MSLVGKTIGRYRIIEQLGQGGMAVVYKAFDTRLQRDVAIKLIRTSAIPLDHLDQLQKRFEREALTQSKFNHPNIVSIFDYGEHEGAPYLVMAYSLGGTLQDLTGTPIPYPQAAALLAPIADALAYAHEMDVLHRDVKPSNILFDAKSNPSLTDFGIAKLLGEVDSATLTGTGMGIGTPQYMAPEQWKGKPEKATDIYALGVVLYELITGQKPYDAETPAALILIQATEPLPAPTDFVPDLPEHVEKVLYNALAPAPEDRYEDMAEFAKVLGGLSREEVVAPEPKPALPQTEVMLPIEEPSEAPAEPEPTTPQPIEPVVPTLYPQETPTEATPLPVEPEVEKESNIPPPPKPKTKFKMPVWGWGLIGLFVLAGIVFGVAQLDFGGTPVAEGATETATEGITATITKQPTVTVIPTATMMPTATPVVQINNVDGAHMAYIPAGEFEMGGDGYVVHTVYTDTFWMYQYEVTNAQYAAFLNAMGNQTEDGATWLDAKDSDVLIKQYGGNWLANSGYADHPVVEVSWYGAAAYCEWAGGRLPTEAEWEKAARGGLVGMTYPWGNQTPICTEGAENGAQFGNCNDKTVPVGSFAPNGYRLYDMAGNVWEWVGDWYDSSYYANSPTENPQGPASGDVRVLRGGSWLFFSGPLHVAYRDGLDPLKSHSYGGFRCSLSPNP